MKTDQETKRADARPRALAGIDGAERVEGPRSDVKLDSEDSQDSEESYGHTRSPASQQGGARQQAESIEEAEAEETDPFTQCVLDAIDAEKHHEGAADGWRSLLWNFTRQVKSWCRVGTDVEHAFRSADRVIRERCGGWYSALAFYGAVEVGGYEEFLDGDGAEVAYTYFRDAWQKIRYRADETPLDQALSKARAYPMRWDPPGVRRSPRYDEFVSLAIWLQFTMGDNDICLPVQAVAQRLNTDQRIVSLWRRRAENDGLLVKTKEHTFKVGGRGQATMFRVPDHYVERARKYANGSA